MPGHFFLFYENFYSYTLRARKLSYTNDDFFVTIKRITECLNPLWRFSAFAVSSFKLNIYIDIWYVADIFPR